MRFAAPSTAIPTMLTAAVRMWRPCWQARRLCRSEVRCRAVPMLLLQLAQEQKPQPSFATLSATVKTSAQRQCAHCRCQRIRSGDTNRGNRKLFRVAKRLIDGVLQQPKSSSQTSWRQVHSVNEAPLGLCWAPLGLCWAMTINAPGMCNATDSTTPNRSAGKGTFIRWQRVKTAGASWCRRRDRVSHWTCTTLPRYNIVQH
jgi:hypothetical protein